MENSTTFAQDKHASHEGSILKPRMGRLAAASSIGTTLEWFDFTIYNLMAALVFNTIFFPSFDPMTGTILAFSTYAVGYLSRPFGGIVFGHLGDKLGRRFVLVATLVMMGAATGAMGLLPTYQVWGIWSPILLVALRFLQGAAIGGEWAGAVLLSMEHGDQRHRGLNASFAQVGPACGTLLGAGFLAMCSTLLSTHDFQYWGWRIPFLSSAILVAFGLWLRRGVDETPMFKQLERHSQKAQLPIKEVVAGHWRRLLIAGSVRIGSDLVYGLLIVFSLTYITTILHLPRSLALTATMLGSVLHAICVPIFGGLSDRLGRRIVYGSGAVLSIAWAFAYFALMDSRQPASICAAVVIGMLFQAMMYGPQASFVTEQFPTRVRYAGASLAATLGGIVGGAFGPLAFAALYKAYLSVVPIALYVGTGLAITLAALYAARETARDPLQE
ncbi:MHS family MFS transporter [Burkholderia latens]|uniref:MFS transporter n=2 Tax=Burkholderiaceae TaxID=119060 RepID=A0A6H9THL5_9BURK|nr:MHS family MFS transporter [Burkholderia latens]MBJ9924398.1 MHS family MFS transporter [Burkholderia cenocepacia]VWB23616.1 MFS transporter [Burkholderia latens]HDR9882393.1 MFS transporter [Burkholderia cenocepacia]HDR9889745.1 MFS transporter [Burkholderia cenocepacia]